MSMIVRHRQLADAAKTATERHLHLVALRKHEVAHVSELHRRDALKATQMAFDEAIGGTALTEDAGEKHDPSNGQFTSGGGGTKAPKNEAQPKAGNPFEAMGQKDPMKERLKAEAKTGQAEQTDAHGKIADWEGQLADAKKKLNSGALSKEDTQKQIKLINNIDSQLDKARKAVKK